MIFTNLSVQVILVFINIFSVVIYIIYIPTFFFMTRVNFCHFILWLCNYIYVLLSPSNGRC